MTKVKWLKAQRGGFSSVEIAVLSSWFVIVVILGYFISSAISLRKEERDVREHQPVEPTKVTNTSQLEAVTVHFLRSVPGGLSKGVTMPPHFKKFWTGKPMAAITKFPHTFKDTGKLKTIWMHLRLHLEDKMYTELTINNENHMAKSAGMDGSPE
uniref:Uncharacterized protein n=1 Tax=Trichuris muris TaxID=70415 RepID=A0A5S6QQX7_TRIMR